MNVLNSFKVIMLIFLVTNVFFNNCYAKSVGMKSSLNSSKNMGRTGRQAKLRSLEYDKSLSAADRGWIRQEKNSIERKQRRNIRNPPNMQLAHGRGFEAQKGFGYEKSYLLPKDLHKLQHKHDNNGKKQKYGWSHQRW
jgi:hypothetical protein